VSDSADEGPQIPVRRQAGGTVSLAIALLVVALDGTIVGTAMPQILAELGALNYYAWVTTAYLVTSTVTIPVAGKLGDIFGRKPLVVGGLGGFLAASWVAGASSTALELVIMRGVQGVFGGVLTAVTFATLADILPLRRRVMMHGLFSAIIGLASAAAPTLGGYITDSWGWRWIFYVNVPLGALAVILALMFLPYLPTQGAARSVDVAGGVTLTIALVPLLIALSISASHSWTSPLMLALVGISVVMLPVFLAVEHRAAEPIVPLGLFRRSVFTIALVIAAGSAVGLYGLAVYVPLLYQGVFGVSATDSGALLAPLLIGMLVAAVLSGQLIARVRRYRLVGTIGLSCMIGGIFLLAGAQPGTPRWHVIAELALAGAGMGLTWPLSTAVVQAALPQVVGVATSQVNFWRNLGGTVSVVLLGSLLSGRVPAAIDSRLSRLHLPAQLRRSIFSGGSQQSVQTLFDSAHLAEIRAGLPAGQRPVFDAALGAVRLGLADVLHQIFLLAAVILVVPLVASVFLKETPIPQKGQRSETGRSGAEAAR
jgi:EmrB/QacA subfamily drug resistance transporter